MNIKPGTFHPALQRMDSLAIILKLRLILLPSEDANALKV